ncbi:Lsr2 family DNA-binding protein [Amycolatopsis panacis]|uniref:Lsr2 DNA-binding domain-containing protein n=1 Tax=Amycolatopsis panacis TaxID=2340917 RepID=A0A419IBH6_9PSEU|nr:histone-like nucleoid-structuring protein Lsr2 [Amycolatopsis panacis]RJQ91306.1 hypothetical protein D5S19_02265 [Amycolatopsis panacis]
MPARGSSAVHQLSQGPSSARSPSAADRKRGGDIRAWAAENGFSVSDRGRISLQKGERWR